MLPNRGDGVFATESENDAAGTRILKRSISSGVEHRLRGFQRSVILLVVHRGEQHSIVAHSVRAHAPSVLHSCNKEGLPSWTGGEALSASVHNLCMSTKIAVGDDHPLRPTLSRAAKSAPAPRPPGASLVAKGVNTNVEGGWM